MDRPRKAAPDERTALRTLIVAACRDREFEDESLPTPQCKDHAEWRDLIHSLMDHVLWDRHWLEEMIEPDDDPDHAKMIHEAARIAPEYYAAVPPDPTPAQLERIKTELMKLCEG